MLLAPQDDLVECVHPANQEDDAGRCAVAKADICPGELVLLAAPYAVSLNPNESASAMYIVAKVEEWESVSGRGNAAGNKSASRSKKKGRSVVAGAQDEHVPLTPCASFCSNCLQRIPVGTPFLNYETIRCVSDDIAAEHAEREEMRRLKKDVQEEEEEEEEEGDGCESPQANLADTSGNGVVGKGNDNKKIKALQKPTKSTRMRSKGYVELKQKLSEAAAARREAAIYEHHMKGTDSEEVKSVSWPERVVENELNRPEDVLDRGVCGCAGCGVIVYCSRDCWQEYREVHKTTGACQTLRGVYPSLMKAFMTRGGKNPKSAAAKQSLLDSWSVKQWLRRTSEETAWDIQLLLLAALVMARCAKEGFASHMAEELTASPDTVNVGGIGETTEEAGCSITSELVTESIREDKGPSSRSATTGTAESLPVAVSIATDSAMPKEMETIRARRLRCGTALEILDAKAVEHERDADAPAPAPSQLYVVLKDRAVLRVSNAKEATNAIRDPCWTDVARLVTNLSVLNKDSRSSFRSYYRRFNELVLPWICGGGETDTIFSVTADFFDRLGAASQCNSFGLFDAKDIRIGVTLYPEASYFNHSCFPNLCRVTSRGCLAAFYALRAIRKGEPLTICYVDIQEASTAERRRNLLRSYRFFCQCGRCRGTTAPTTTSITTSSNSSTLMDIPLCDACDAHGYMCPVPPEASLCWGMDEVQERECTVCHRRVRWIHK